MKVANAMWLACLLGYILTYIEVLVTLTCPCVSCNGTVSHHGFMLIEVQSKDISFDKLSLPTSRSNSSLTFESYYEITFSFPLIAKGDTYDLDNHTLPSNFTSHLIVVFHCARRKNP